MRKVFLLLLFTLSAAMFLRAQVATPNNEQRKEISSLIEHYSKARENGDTVLLKRILTENVDQLVSDGEWRNGIEDAVQGMLRSSANAPGTRTLTIEKMRMLHLNLAIVDCRYEIQNPGDTVRKMWSTFIVVADKGTWKIAAIRNMQPAER